MHGVPWRNPMPQRGSAPVKSHILDSFFTLFSLLLSFTLFNLLNTTFSNIVSKKMPQSNVEWRE